MLQRTVSLILHVVQYPTMLRFPFHETRGVALLAVLPFAALLLLACNFEPPMLDSANAADAGPPPTVGDDAPPAAVCEPFTADSFLDFSGTQGQGSWHYGYFENPANGRVFVPFSNFSNATWTPDQFVWTEIGPTLVHPNGLNGNTGREAVEQWVVRRWVSDTEGLISITGSIARFQSNTNGNGVIARIFVDDNEVWTLIVSNEATTPIDMALTTQVSVGSTVDFVVDPRDRDDGADATHFSVQLQCAPTAG